MPDKKLTDNEIVKALECCMESNSCSKCPFANIADIRICTSKMSKNTLDLINRQKAEINRKEKVFIETLRRCALKDEIISEKTAEIERVRAKCETRTQEKLELGRIYTQKLKTAKAEAHKEFAERLKDKFFKIRYCESYYCVVDIDDIDNLLKKLVGDSE